MIEIKQLDASSKSQVKEFVDFQYKLYKDCPQFTPPFRGDIKRVLLRNHPFFEHSDGTFFMAYDDGEMVGRIAAMENTSFNKYHDTKKGQFYYFDCIDSQDVANALFDKAFEWLKSRGLNEVVGPKGFGAFDGYGIQVEGMEHHQMMNMMNYNYAYYSSLAENYGFEKVLDFVSCYIEPDKFLLPEKVKEIDKKVREKGNFTVKYFSSKKELMSWALKIGEAYNKTFVNNWEYYPLTDSEIQFLKDDILAFADHRLIKIIMHKDDIVGFLFGFPDVSAAMKRHNGKLTPWAMADILLEAKRTKWISLNGAGILPEYHGRGGNALLYTEIYKTIMDYGYLHAEQTQMADTAVQIRKDMVNLGVEIYKSHRIYHKLI